MEETNGRHQRTADVIVVGAGHNGLTAACYLQKAGLDVLVVEASPTFGGMTSTNATLPNAPGHLINEGAIHATGIFRASSVAADLELERYGMREKIVDPVHVQLGPDGSSFAVWTDPRKTIEELRRLSPRDARAWEALSETLDAAMDVLIPYMKSHPTRPSRELITALGGSARRPGRLFGLARLMTAPHAEYIDENFEHPLSRGVLATMAAFSLMTNDATAWALIYLGMVQKVKSSMLIGGTGALPDALHRCLLDQGGHVRTSATVEEIIVRGGRAAGVRLAGGEELQARRGVLTTCNPKLTLTRLLPAGTLPEQLETRAHGIPTGQAQVTSLKINLALSGRVSLPRHEAWRDDGLDLRHPLLAWHTLEEHVKAWDDVVRGDYASPLPLGCVTIPTATDPTQGPDGQDTFWLWSQLLPLRPREQWEQARERIGNEVLADCATYYDGLAELEIERAVLGGPELEERFNAPDGNVYHVDPTVLRFGPLKPAMGLGSYRTPVDGLFLSGAGTHPTGGLCALPGKLAAEALLRTPTDPAAGTSGRLRRFVPSRAAGARNGSGHGARTAPAQRPTVGSR